MTAATGIGARVLRTEDKRFLTGTGRYVDDLPLARATYAYFLRSPHAHAKIKSLDISAAAKMPGVVNIFTGKDLVDAKVGGLICGWVVKDKHGQPHKAPPHPVMALDTVRYVGDTVAMIVANSHDEAKDAAEAIKVDYEVKPATIYLAKALDKVRPGGLVAFVTSHHTMDATDSTVRKYLASKADLVGIGAQVKVSYDTQSTRLHAKAWIFQKFR